MHPEQFLYTKDHEWLKVDGDTAAVGITDHAQQQLGDIVYLELPEAGSTFKSNDAMGSVESVKAVSDIYCPVAGEIIETNGTLTDSPETVNSDPHGEGWLLKLKVQNLDELGGLLSAADYEKLIESEQS